MYGRYRIKIEGRVSCVCCFEWNRREDHRCPLECSRSGQCGVKSTLLGFIQLTPDSAASSGTGLMKPQCGVSPSASDFSEHTFIHSLLNQYRHTPTTCEALSGGWLTSERSHLWHTTLSDETTGQRAHILMIFISCLDHRDTGSGSVSRNT